MFSSGHSPRRAVQSTECIARSPWVGVSYSGHLYLYCTVEAQLSDPTDRCLPFCNIFEHLWRRSSIVLYTKCTHFGQLPDREKIHCASDGEPVSQWRCDSEHRRNEYS